ncbi:hypothetical protein EDD11_005576 [Mortierella claussenii]|nr:hypothetical protein EDD11_005576 [Mortierella claussenii]
MKPTEAGAGGISGMFRISSYHHPLRKREDNSISPFVTVKVAGPNPIPTGCPTTRQINYMGVAADCTYVRAYGGLENARKQILADFNTASAIYESTFNIALGIVRMQIESMNCPATPIKGKLWNQKCSTNYTIGNRLSDFSHWRGLFGKSTDGAGLWHLMTDCNTGAVAGVAWTKSLCESGTTAQGSGNETQYTSFDGLSD